MAKFGHTLISGIAWIIIACGIGLFGAWLIGSGGIWGVVGWILNIAGFGFAVLAAFHLFRITSWQIRGMRMMRDDPEEFDRLRRQWERRKDDEDEME